MCRALSRIVIALATLAGLAACTLVDGVSDLQGGRKAGADGGKGDDASDPVDAAADDARAASDGSLANVACGAAHCPAGQGCCLSISTGSKRCQTRAQCMATQDYFLSCTSSKTCPATAPVCCFDFGDELAACVGQCGAGQSELCDLLESSVCTGGKKCSKALAGVPSQLECQ